MNAYKIGVSIVLANGVSPVLAIIGKDLLGLKTSISAIEHNFASWTGALIGVGSILAGATILGTMGKLVEKAADFQDAMTKVSQLNPKVAALVNNGEIKRLSFDIGTQLGMKVEDVAKIYGGIYGVLQDPEEAEKLTPYAARYARLMEMRHPGSHPEQSINTLMRAGELSGRLTDEKGQIDPKRVEEWFDLAARLEAATHGQVNPNTLLGLAQQGGGVALRGLSQEGYEHMAIVAQMMGGQRAGTSLLSLRSQMTGAMMKRSAQAMQQYGLLKEGEWQSEAGHVTMSDEASHRMLSLVNQDPMAFVNELVDRLEEKGITNKDDQMLALQRILGRQTTQRMVADMLLARQQINRETAGLEQGATVQQGLQGYRGNIHASQENLHNAWHNLMVAIGGPESERFAGFLNKIADAVNWVTAQVTKLKPETIDTVFKVVAGFAVGLITIGGIIAAAVAITAIGALVSGAVLIGGAIAAVVAAVAAFIYLDWDRISDWFRSLYASVSSFASSGWEKIKETFYGIGHAISSFVTTISALLGSFIDRTGSAARSLAAAVETFVNLQWTKITEIFNGIASAISGFFDKIAALFARVRGLAMPDQSAQPGSQEFRKGLDEANKRYTPMRFVPGTDAPRMQQASLSLNVDGRTLAQAVIDQLESLYGMSTGAPAPDGVSMPFGVDHQYGGA